MNWWTIFLTGLTTGGLSCLAMQGGLLASTIANQKDDEIEKVLSEKSSKKISSIESRSFDQLDWLPVMVFLGGKLLSHTLFGFLLGFLGGTLELSLTARLIFQGFAALFMFATAMNLLDVHPLFRYVVIQPPKFFTRIVRNSTKSKAVFTPFLIGFLTILIPCGVTQSMEVLAMTSGNPLLGAGIMFVFVLGTSPLFGLLGVGVAKLSETWNVLFMRIAALTLILLTISSVNGIMVVLDSPFTLQKVKSTLFDPPITSMANTAIPNTMDGNTQAITISIVNSGYVPNKIQVKSGIPVQLTLNTKDTYSCASDFVFPVFNLRARLGPNDSKTLLFTPKKPGNYVFSCSMGMYTGVIQVI